MPTRSRTSFQKRQKEILRMEKQREKAAKRLQRKAAAKEGGGADALEPESPQADDSIHSQDSDTLGTV
ncbi:MAG TPA: hypothetical protein VGF59_06640 [Bryobacteraceae bacterium]|jgi:hypothetical protein